MEEVFNLLDYQPTGCPKWELAQDSRGFLLYEKHMFLFEADEFGLPGRMIPACRFIDGAEWVGRVSPLRRTYASDGDPLCQNCMEVSLQHGLARVC